MAEKCKICGQKKDEVYIDYYGWQEVCFPCENKQDYEPLELDGGTDD